MDFRDLFDIRDFARVAAIEEETQSSFLRSFKMKGFRCYHKFGFSNAVDILETDLTGDGSPYLFWPESAQLLEIGSTSVLDTNGGAGAWAVRVIGLSSSWMPQIEEVNLSGTVFTPLTKQFIRVYRAQVTRPDSPFVFNLGNITVRVLGGGDIAATISAGDNQTLMAVYSTAVNEYGLVNNFRAFGGKGDDTVANLYVRPFGEPFQLAAKLPVFETPSNWPDTTCAPAPPMSDVKVTAIKSVGGTASVSGIFNVMQITI